MKEETSKKIKNESNEMTEKKEYQRKVLDRVIVYAFIGIAFNLITYAIPKLETVTFIYPFIGNIIFFNWYYRYGWNRDGYLAFELCIVLFVCSYIVPFIYAPARMLSAIIYIGTPLLESKFSRAANAHD